MQICPTCGEPNSDGELFCYLCGQPLENNEKQINNDNIVVKIKPSKDEVEKANEDAMQQMLQQMMELSNQENQASEPEEEEYEVDEYEEYTDDYGTEGTEDEEYPEDYYEDTDSYSKDTDSDYEIGYDDYDNNVEEEEINPEDIPLDQSIGSNVQTKKKTSPLVFVFIILGVIAVLGVGGVLSFNMIRKMSGENNEPEINVVQNTDNKDVTENQTKSLDDIVSNTAQTDVSTVEESTQTLEEIKEEVPTEVEESVATTDTVIISQDAPIFVEGESTVNVGDSTIKIKSFRYDDKQEFDDFKNNVYNLMTEMVEDESQIELFKNSDTQYGYMIIDKANNNYYVVIFDETDELKASEVTANNMDYDAFMTNLKMQMGMN